MSAMTTTGGLLMIEAAWSVAGRLAGCRKKGICCLRQLHAIIYLNAVLYRYHVRMITFPVSCSCVFLYFLHFSVVSVPLWPTIFYFLSDIGIIPCRNCSPLTG